MGFDEVDELYRSNLDRRQGRGLRWPVARVGDDRVNALRKADRAAVALTKRQVGPQDWASYRTEATTEGRRQRNRGDKSSTPFTNPSRSDHREQVAQQRADMNQYRQWQTEFLAGGSAIFPRSAPHA